jgi:6-phosphofructokinase 1
MDNNLPFLDQSFGFFTAVQQSIEFIDAANVEAEGAEYGIGIVRLAGRQCGYFATNSCLASRDVNICVIPEIQFQIYGINGVYESIIERAKKKGHCIIVVAEGAFRGLIE